MTSNNQSLVLTFCFCYVLVLDSTICVNLEVNSHVCWLCSCTQWPPRTQGYVVSGQCKQSPLLPVQGAVLMDRLEPRNPIMRYIMHVWTYLQWCKCPLKETNRGGAWRIHPLLIDLILNPLQWDSLIQLPPQESQIAHLSSCQNYAVTTLRLTKFRQGESGLFFDF